MTAMDLRAYLDAAERRRARRRLRFIAAAVASLLAPLVVAWVLS